jgi:hypothetical protein
MLKVFKYGLEWYLTEISLPVNARVLAVDSQGNQPFLWALVNPHASRTVKRKFLILATGQETKEKLLDLIHIDTFQSNPLYGGNEIYHAFEIKEYI